MTPPTSRPKPHIEIYITMSNFNTADRFPVRKHPRLRNFDYSSCNYYFITICTQDKNCLFGSPGNLSVFGKIAEDCLQHIESHFAQIYVDKWVVMPNHIHAIVILPGNHVELPTVIGQYKSAVTKKIHLLNPDIKVWQSSFHDHIIRNQTDYERIWVYIDTNPARWLNDCFYSPQAE